jgi:hypothetical protein
MTKPRTDEEKAAQGKGYRRSRTVSYKTVQREVARNQIEYPTDIERPKHRSDCANVPRPCPFVTCRYNLFCDIKETGALILNYPGLEPDEVVNSCALDLADKGDHSMEEIGRIMRTCRQMVFRVEQIAKAKIWAMEKRRQSRKEESLIDQWERYFEKHT